MIDVDQAREDIARATKAAGEAATYWVGLHYDQLRPVHPGTQTVLTVQAAIAYLVSKGVITVAGPEAFKGLMLEVLKALPEPFASDLDAALDAAGRAKA